MVRLRNDSDAELIAELYGYSVDGAPEEFCERVLSRLATHSSADSAIWIVVQAAAHRITTVVFHGSPRMPRRADEHTLAAVLLRIAGRNPEATIVRDLRHGTERDPDLRLLRESGVRHLLLQRHPDIGTSFASLVSLQRGDCGPPFSQDECDRLALLLIHAVKARRLALRAYLRLDSLLRAAGRKNRGAACLCDSSGTICEMSPEFAEVIDRRFSGWDRLQLPFPLPALQLPQTVALQCVLASGLHLRIEQSGSLLKLHARIGHPFDILTRREHDVVKAMSAGHSYKNMAQRLGVSAATVANHASNIYRKLGVYNRDDVMELARQGLPAARSRRES